MTNFRVGQKVVCVTATGARNVREGEVYTVRWSGDFPGRSGLDGSIVTKGVILVEVEADGLGFDARRFRPAVERKTDISIFKAMLNPSRVKETA